MWLRVDFILCMNLLLPSIGLSKFKKAREYRDSDHDVYLYVTCPFVKCILL
jgi:hypothetical protein